MHEINLQSFILNECADLKEVFDVLQGKQNDYNWLITNIDLSEYPEEILQQDRIWITGEELTRIVNKYNIQFIWSVLSGFDKEIEIDIDNLDVEPFADGNKNFWYDNPQIQYPLAKVELVCFDSTLFLLMSKDDEISERFKRSFPTAEDLKEYNKKWKKESI